VTLPFSTHSIPGAGGVFKEDPDDFAVDELPAYEPSGEGEHLFLWVHKRGRSTPEVARALARHLGIPERAVSWAGLKDRQASTRQYFCVPSKVEGALMGFVLPGVEVLRATRHRNKLKTGHLRGNRFTLVLREVRDLGAATAALELLVARGVPNFFGEQRFGRDGENAARGKQILQAGGRHRDRF
jgi:tRNA pseudouridine13 synthase